MGKLSIEKQAALIKAFGYERATKMILEFERQDDAPPDATSKDFGVVYKAQRRHPTLADLQQQQKALNARLKALNRANKDATDAAEAEAVLEMLALADRLQLDQDAVMKLVTQYGLTEVTDILRTLTQQKAMKGYYVSPFYGRVTKIDAADLKAYMTQTAQKSKSDRDSFFS